MSLTYLSDNNSLCTLYQIYNRLFCELCATEPLLQLGYSTLYSFSPPLSVLCNVILVCTQTPPPRPLTFPLIHSEIPEGAHSYALVYSHRTASTGLIWLIKVAAVSQLTEQGSWPFCCLFCSSWWLTVLFGGFPDEAGKSSVLPYLPHLDKLRLVNASNMLLAPSL